MSLRRRLGAVLIVAGLLAVAGFVVSGLTMRVVIADQNKVTNRYFSAVLRANEHLLAQVDQETGVRGFQLSGDPQFLEPYEIGVGTEQTTYTQLRGLLAGDPVLLARLEDSRRAAESWRRDYAQLRIELVRREGRIPFSRDELDQGRRQFDVVRAASLSLTTEILGRRDTATAELRQATRVQVGMLIGAGVAILVAGLLLWWALRAWVTRPLERLADQVSRVQEGTLTAAIEPVGPSEVRGLAADVEGMRQRVVTQYAAAVQARAEVEAASRTVEAQAEELLRSNRDLEQFAYVASHDLQEPLRKVSSFCQMLERRYKGQLDERADQYIGFAVDGAKRMQVLINDLLTFSRVGRSTSGFTEVNLQDCYDHALRVLEGRLQEAGAVVTAEPLPTVRGEASLLTQLFQNLIGNAVKFRGSAPPRVQLRVERGAGADGLEQWTFTCADNGIGIDPQYADKIFVIFQRLHTKEEYSGTGIGLALCKKIVEYHGGRIWLAAEASRTGAEDGPSGTTLCWTLPVPVDAPAGGDTASAAPDNIGIPPLQPADTEHRSSTTAGQLS